MREDSSPPVLVVVAVLAAVAGAVALPVWPPALPPAPAPQHVRAEVAVVVRVPPDLRALEATPSTLAKRGGGGGRGARHADRHTEVEVKGLNRQGRQATSTEYRGQRLKA